MAHSKDLRWRVVKYIRQGGSRAEAARRFDVGLRTVYTWMGRGSEQTPRKPGPKGASKVNMKKLAELVGERGTDRMLKEIAKQFSVDQSTVSRAMKRLGVSRKKNQTLRRSEVL